MANQELKGKFRIKLRPGRHLWKNMEFDTRTMSLQTAQQLFDMGWPHISKVKSRNKEKSE